MAVCSYYSRKANTTPALLQTKQWLVIIKCPKKTKQTIISGLNKLHPKPKQSKETPASLLQKHLWDNIGHL